MTAATVFDPVRKRHVAATPEEGVRQAVLRYLLDVIRAPANLIGVEYSLSLLEPGNLRRADIVVWTPGGAPGGPGVQLSPWLLVECKAPGVPVDDSVARQAAAYLGKCACRFVMLTNGKDTRYLEASGKDYRLTSSLPFYPG